MTNSSTLPFVYRCPFDPGDKVRIQGANTPWPKVTGMKWSTKAGLWLIEVTSSEGNFGYWREDEIMRGWPEGWDKNWPR